MTGIDSEALQLIASIYNKKHLIVDNLTVTKDANINGKATITGNTHIKGEATIDKKTTINGKTTVNNLHSLNEVSAIKNIHTQGQVWGKNGVIAGEGNKHHTYLTATHIKHRNNSTDLPVEFDKGAKADYYALSGTQISDPFAKSLGSGDGIFYRNKGQATIGVDDHLLVKDVHRNKYADIHASLTGAIKIGHNGHKAGGWIHNHGSGNMAYADPQYRTTYTISPNDRTDKWYP